MIPGSANPLLLAGAAEEAGYAIERSLRFNSADSAYLNRTPSTAGNRKTWTWAGWVKRSALGYKNLFGCMPATSSYTGIVFSPSDQLRFMLTPNAGFYTTNAVFRDLSAWYHVVCACDSTLADGNDRVKLYVNGVRQSVFLDFSAMPINTDTNVNSTTAHAIGRIDFSGGISYLDGYLADVHFIDGQALDPTSFGEFDANGVWQPIEYTGTYGTNGFHLDFSDNSSAAALGDDTSGNNNDWSVNNISVASGAGNDSLIDVPQNGTETDSGAGGEVRGNYATLNPLGSALNGQSFSNGNLEITGTHSNETLYFLSTIKVSSGKYYVEYDTFNVNAGRYTYGITEEDYMPVGAAAERNNGVGILGYAVGANSIIAKNTVVQTPTADTRSGIWGVAADFDNNQLSFFFNGVQVGTTISITAGNYAFAASQGTDLNRSFGVIANFGQRPFAYDISTGISEATGAIPILSTSDDYGQTLSSGTASDSNSSSLVLALPMNGTNGGTTFTDYSATIKGSGSAKTVTAGGNAQTSTTESKWYGSSLLLDGSGDYLDAGSGFAVGTGDFTAECWARFTGTVNSNESFYSTNNAAWNAGTTNATVQFCTNGSVLRMRFGTTNIDGSTTISVDEWYHVAVTRESGTVRLFLNGQLEGSGTATNDLTADYLRIGNNRDGANYFQGNIQDFRFYNGVAKYTSNFTPPSSALFKALCTANLDEPTIADGSTAMDIALYTGNGTSQTITGLNLSPDLVWLKDRAFGNDHMWTDTVRGATKAIRSNSTVTETTNSQFLTAFTSDGFSVGSNANFNANTNAFVSWCWDAGSSTVSNTDGSITSSVRANPTAGFSIVSYTGTGANATVGHGLNAPIGMVLIKNRDEVKNWVVGHSALATGNSLRLNLTNAVDTAATIFNSTDPTSSVFSVGTNISVNGSADKIIAYCFAPVEGYSAFGSYTGNGSSDGPFVYTGFRVRWLLRKLSSGSGESWRLIDTARSPINVAGERLLADTSVAEGTQPNEIDILSNGFKLRSSDTAYNGSGSTYIYAAFSEHPFRTSRAR